MFLDIWKFMRGYVIISVTGFSPERFINLCANKGIYIWNLEKNRNEFRLCISAKGFKLIRPLVKKTKCRIKIVKKVGLPFKFLIFRSRRIFVFGTLISCLIVFLLTLFIWKIEIVGNSKITDEQLNKYLSNESYYVGMWKRNVDATSLEKKILKSYEQINWVTIEVKGTKLVIYLEEGTKTVDIEDEDQPADIISDKNGIVVSIVTRKGTPQVVKGDVVYEGDLLVSGTLEIKELEQLKAVEFTHSDADIFLKTVYDYSDEVELRYFTKLYTENTKKDYAVQFFGKKINLFKPSIKYVHYDKINTTDELSLFENFYLPVSISTITYKEYELIEKSYTIEEATNLIKNHLNRTIKGLEEDKRQIIENNIKITELDDKIVAKGQIILIEKVGVKNYFDEEERRHEYDEYFREDDANTP